MVKLSVYHQGVFRDGLRLQLAPLPGAADREDLAEAGRVRTQEYTDEKRIFNSVRVHPSTYLSDVGGGGEVFGFEIFRRSCWL